MGSLVMGDHAGLLCSTVDDLDTARARIGVNAITIVRRPIVDDMTRSRVGVHRALVQQIGRVVNLVHLVDVVNLITGLHHLCRNLDHAPWTLDFFLYFISLVVLFALVCLFPFSMDSRSR